VQAERFHDLLADQPVLNDVRLSTAALNSARFPLISPAGTIRNKDQRIIDRIVDGGYFENYGVLSAKELALAIHAYDPNLFPLVVVISNDPDDLLSPDDDVTRNPAQSKTLLVEQKSKARTRISGPEPVTDIVTPVKTVINARTAHGLLGVAEHKRAVLTARHPRRAGGPPLNCAFYDACGPITLHSCRAWPLPRLLRLATQTNSRVRALPYYSSFC
jgi:hypothetical protein